MNMTVARYVNRLGTRGLRPTFQTLKRTAMNEPGPPDPCAKPEPCMPPTTCPEPPPCPTMPQCPPTICPPVVDPNDPCNYSPPPYIDPSYPDITKLKKQQCFFQQEDDLPIYLKKGNTDAFLYQLSIVSVILSFGLCIMTIFKIVGN